MAPDTEFHISTEVLDRYLAGRCTAAEEALVAQWMAGAHGRRESVAALKDWGARETDLEAWLQRVKGEAERRGERRRVRGADVQGSWGNRTLRRMLWPLGSISALLAVFFIAHLGSLPATGTTRSYTTGVNQQGIVTLPDGTRVTLAPQTTLRLTGFSTRTRTVAVDGQAYFEVTHTAGAPFEVHSGPAVTQVLGTAFLVDYRSVSSKVRVAVEEGKVRVSNGPRVAAGATVSAGYVGEVTDSSISVNTVENPIAGAELIGGKLVFHHMSVATVLQALTRWYGYQFRCADSTLPQREVTIGLSVRSSASALARLEQVLNVNLSVTGDTVTLTPQSEQRSRGMPRVRSYDVWTPTREVGR